MHTVILHTNNSMTTLQQYINSRCLWTWKIVHSARTMRIANKFRNEMQSVRQQLNTFPGLIPIQMDMLSPLCVCGLGGGVCALVYCALYWMNVLRITSDVDPGWKRIIVRISAKQYIIVDKYVRTVRPCCVRRLSDPAKLDYFKLNPWQQLRHFFFRLMFEWPWAAGIERSLSIIIINYIDSRHRFHESYLISIQMFYAYHLSIRAKRSNEN